MRLRIGGEGLLAGRVTHRGISADGRGHAQRSWRHPRG